MRIEGQYTFDGPRGILWELVRDPKVLAGCLPGSPSVRQVGEHEYEGEIAHGDETSILARTSRF